MFVRTLCLALLFSSLVMAQKEDRRRVNATPFDKSKIILNAVETARWKVGSGLYFTPILGFRQLGYDNNVFSTEVNEVNDFSISPELGMVAYYRKGRWIWENSASYDYLYYADLESLRGGEYGGETRLHGIFKKFYLDMGVDYQRDRQRLTTEIDDRVYSDRINSDINLSLQPSPRSQVNLSANLKQLNYDDQTGAVVFSRLEREELGLAMRYNYRLGEQFWPFLEVSRNSFDFKQIGNPNDNSTFTGLFVGLRSDRGERLTLDAKIGLQQLDFETQPALVDSIEGPVLDPSIQVDMDDTVLALEGFVRYRVTRRHYIEGSVLNAPLFSVSPLYSFFVSSKASMEVGIETRNRVRMGPEIVLGSNNYHAANQVPQADPLRKDDFRGLNFNVSIPIQRIFELRLSAGYIERESNQSGASTEGYQISTSMRYRNSMN